MHAATQLYGKVDGELPLHDVFRGGKFGEKFATLCMATGHTSWHACTFNITILGWIVNNKAEWQTNYQLKRHKDHLNDYRKGWNVTSIYSMVLCVDKVIVRHSVILYTRQS